MADKDTTVEQTTKKEPCYVHKFRKPFEWESKSYETLNFYFEKLTGQDLIDVEREMNAQGDIALEASTSLVFQCKIAARAADIGSDVLMKMPAKEFNRICGRTQRFLLT